MDKTPRKQHASSDMEENAQRLKALAHPVRIEILRYLLEGPSCATLTNQAIPVSQPNLSQHLRALREAGLLRCCKAGARRCYYLSRPSLVKSLLGTLEEKHPEIIKEASELIKEVKARRARLEDSGGKAQPPI